MSDYPFESFIFYRSFRDAIEEMSDEDKLATLLAICDYALYGIEPELKGVMPRAVFTVAKPSIDVAQAKRANGKRGGRPSKRKTNGFDEKNHRFSKSESTDTDTDTGTDTGADTDTSAAPTPTPAQKLRSRFVPPTLEEVAAYVQERGSKVDPQGFIDFYASKGWMVGKNPMKDWRAACRNAEKWERWQQRGSTQNQVKTAADYESGDDFFT